MDEETIGGFLEDRVPPERLEKKPDPPRFGAGKAALALLFFLLVQLITGVAVVTVAMVFAVFQGEKLDDPARVNRVIASTVPALLVMSGITSALAVVAVARVWAWDLVRDTSDAGIGISRPRRGHVLAASGAGIVLSVAYLITAVWLVPHDPTMPVGPLAAAARGGLLNRIAFAVIALLFAPAVEEFFFRGLLLKGFSTSWGQRAGGVVVTVVFVLMHLTETFRYWPATVTIALLAIGTLVARRISGSLGPAVALHVSYNLVIVCVALAAPLRA